MVVRLATRDPFSGLLFSQAGGKSCQTRGQQRTQTELQILFRDTDVDRCAVLSYIHTVMRSLYSDTQKVPTSLSPLQTCSLIFCKYPNNINLVLIFGGVNF